MTESLMKCLIIKVKDMRDLKFIIYFIVFMSIYSCKSIEDNTIAVRDKSPLIVYRYIHKEYNIDTIFYNNKIQDGYGILSGYVIFYGVEDTIKGMHADIFKTYLHILDTNFNQRVDGMFNFLLPVGNYKICIEAYGFFPIVNEVKIRDKEEQRINYFIDGKWIH